MVADWNEYSLLELATIISGGTPKTLNPKYWGGDIPWLSVVDFNNDNRWVFQTEKKITEKGLSESSTNMLKKGNLIISARGTVGALAQLAEDMTFNQSCYGLNANSELTNNDYLYYAIRNAIAQIKRNTHGAVFDTITRETFKHIKLRIPKIQVQVAISNILGCLDKKISHNQEINRTLEAIAQALFKSWFVNFDPVRAKAEGRVPEGIDAETATFFPDGFEESQLGLVPKGWGIEKIENLLELAYGKALKATDRVLGAVPVYGSGGITGFHNKSLVKEPSIIVGRKGTVGSLYWEDKSFFPIDTVFYVKTKEPLTYCYYLLKILGLEGMNTDAAVPGLNRNNVYRLPIVKASKNAIQAFDKIVSPLRQKIFSNLEQANTLTVLRDTLLPRLISGQLEVSNDELSKEFIA
jgi:type I restriction enzyme S subunit